MKTGFVTYYSNESAELAQRCEFSGLEVFVGRDTVLDLDTISSAYVNKERDAMNNRGLSFLTLSCSVNHLSANSDERAFANRYFMNCITRCHEFGTDIIVTNAYADRSAGIRENLVMYRRVFSQYAETAEKHNVRVAIENCPHWIGYPLTIGNLGFGPELFDCMFALVPSKSIGIEFDPSHLYWQGIDDVAMLKRYADRIYSFHAKDTEILEEQKKFYGIIGKTLDKENEWETGWWRYRIPGFGQINWKAIFNTLSEISYTGPMIIEHEDPVFSGEPSENGGEVNKTETGLRLGLHYLQRQFME